MHQFIGLCSVMQQGTLATGVFSLHVVIPSQRDAAELTKSNLIAGRQPYHTKKICLLELCYKVNKDDTQNAILLWWL